MYVDSCFERVYLPLKRIIVFRGGALGDFILAVPVLAALRRQYQEAELWLVSRPAYASLAMASGLAHAAIPIDSARISRFFCQTPDFPETEKRIIESVDLAVSFMSDSDGVLQNNMQRLGVGKWFAIPHQVLSGHATDHFLAYLAKSGFVQSAFLEPEPRLKLKNDCVEHGRVLLENRAGCKGPWALLHPGSGSQTKNWPIDRFLELANGLLAVSGLQPVFLAGEADAFSVQRIMESGARFPVLNNLDVLELAGALATGRVYVGNDSGVSHMAAALGVPALVLFGPTDPDGWAPRGPFVRILRSDPPSTEGLKNIATAAVLEAAMDVYAQKI